MNIDKNTITLYPCPFCGAGAFLFFKTYPGRTEDTYQHRVECVKCGAEVKSKWNKEYALSAAEAVEKWNKRSEPSEARATIGRGENGKDELMTKDIENVEDIEVDPASFVKEIKYIRVDKVKKALQEHSAIARRLVIDATGIDGDKHMERLFAFIDISKALFPNESAASILRGEEK